MSDPAPQTYANHARYVPLYHFGLFAMLLINLVWTVRNIITQPTTQRGVDLMLAIALVIISWYMRAFATAVQDRVIRLEETLRYQRVLPPDLQARAKDLTLKQMVALRFAGDAELPALARRALDEPVGGKAIKQAVQSWRPDHVRA